MAIMEVANEYWVVVALLIISLSSR
jgi:hypothetical protein